MGQVSTPISPPSLILSAVDRLVASNADGGLSPASSHVILLGQDAGENLSASKVIAIGWNTFKGGAGGMSSADADGSTVVGENSFPGPADLTTGKVSGLGAVTILGSDNYASVTTSRGMAGIILVGAGIAPDYTGVNDGGMDRSILIGNSIFRFNTLDNAPSADNVIIGHQACKRTSLDGQATQFLESVVIGSRAGPQTNSGATVNGNTIVGALAGQTIIGNNGDNVVIGRRAGAGLVSGGKNVMMGAGAVVAGDGTESIAIGNNNIQGNSDRSIYLGANHSRQFTSDRNVVIGYAAGEGADPSVADQFILETYDGITQRTLLAGDFSKGCIIVGLSNPATNRDLPGTNCLKLINGTATGNPVGGGMLRSVAGLPVWRDTAGNDYLLAGNGFLGTFTVATLPAAPPTGAAAYVTDALAPAFAAAVAGGGAVFTPVYYNGAAWFAG